jgi:hypothetical protein
MTILLIGYSYYSLKNKTFLRQGHMFKLMSVKGGGGVLLGGNLEGKNCSEALD